jgi:hypothetical protein
MKTGVLKDGLKIIINGLIQKMISLNHLLLIKIRDVKMKDVIQISGKKLMDFLSVGVILMTPSDTTLMINIYLLSQRILMISNIFIKIYAEMTIILILYAISL